MTHPDERRLTDAAADMSEAISAVVDRHGLNADDYLVVMAIPVGGVLATSYPDLAEREAAMNRFRRMMGVAGANAVRRGHTS